MCSLMQLYVLSLNHFVEKLVQVRKTFGSRKSHLVEGRHPVEVELDPLSYPASLEAQTTNALADLVYGCHWLVKIANQHC